MATNDEVLRFLRPAGGYIQIGTDYEGIEFVECESFTKKEYQEAFKLVDEAKALEAQDKSNAKKLLLEKLGITEDEAKLLFA